MAFFVCANRDGVLTPVGTTFLVGLLGEHGAWFTYFVTANHVVRDGTPRWIRMRRRDGGIDDVDVLEDWVPHPTADIAAIPCGLDFNTYVANWQSEEHFCDKWPPGAPMNLGAPAYF